MFLRKPGGASSFLVKIWIIRFAISPAIADRSCGRRPSSAEATVIGSITLTELTKRLDDQERSRKPDRAAPVGIAAFDLVFRLGGSYLTSPVPNTNGISLVVLRQAADAVVGKELCRVQDPFEHATQLILIHHGQ